MNVWISSKAPTAQALGKLLIFYWWPRLSKHNKNRPSVISNVGKADGSRKQSCIRQFEISNYINLKLCLPRKLPSNEGHWKEATLIPVLIGSSCWFSAISMMLWPERWEGDGILLVASSRVWSRSENKRSPWVPSISLTQTPMVWAYYFKTIRTSLRCSLTWSCQEVAPTCPGQELPVTQMKQRNPWC